MTMHPRVFIGYRYSYENWKEGELQLTKVEENDLSPTVEVNEYQAIRIRFESTDSLDRLYVDRFDSDELLELSPSKTEELVQANDTDNMPAPGHYMVRLETKQGTYQGMYTIKGSNFDEDRFFYLRKYLEQKIAGLSYDIVTRRFGVYVDENQSSAHVLNIYQHIQSKLRRLKHALGLIIEAPSEHIVQQYHLRSVSKKPDLKSQRWLATKGGQKNINLYRPENFYEKHAVITPDVPENQWLKWFLVFLKRNIKNLEYSYRKRLESQKTRIKSAQEKLEQVDFSLSNYDQKGMQYGSQTVVRQLRKEREGIKRTLQQEEANGEKIQNELQQILRIVSMFSRYLENGWLKDVKYMPVFKRPPLLVLRDQRYSVLYRLYKDIHTDMKRNPSNRQSTYPFKRSSVLMEVYSTCLVIDVLKELEFDWDSGWLADHYQEQYVGELLTGERMIFRKNEYRLELIYDQEIPKRLNEDEFGFIANNHSRPDLRLDLYNTDGKLIKSLIIEVKYRKYRYLWNARLNRETDDFIQISDYNRILYRCPIERNRSNKIDKVITLYPKQTNGTAYEHKYDKTVTFIQIEPIDPNSGEVSFGYGYLKKEIGEFIEKNILLSNRDILGGSLTVK